MVAIERKDDYGNVSVKRFERLKDAFKYLKSDEVKSSIESGFTFSFKEEDSGGDPNGG